MKKLLLALSLTLCLAVCLALLTSCGGCDHIWATDATVDTAATCTEEGSSSVKCTLCGEKKADSVTAIPATGHEYATDAYTAPTCTTDGSETKICATCGGTTTETIPATGEHTWSEYPTVDVEATCTSDGSQSIKCTGCQAIKPDSTETIPAAHIWGVLATVDVAPTCTEPGSQSIKCIFCNDKQAGTEEAVPATGHTDLPIVLAPTVFSEGLAEGTCSTCGATGTQPVAKTEAVVEVLTPATSPEYKKYNYLSDVLGEDDHFYPTEENPNGKSLYIEFSLLWNETLANTKLEGDSGYVVFGRIEGVSTGSFQPMWFSFVNNVGGGDPGWCNIAGGFDLGNAVEYGNIYGPLKAGEDGATFSPIGEYGWHRIGLVYTQVTDSTAPGNMIVEIYINGVLVSSYYFNASDKCLLYYGNDIDGYEDNIDAKACYYHIRKSLTTGEDAYFIIADQAMSTDGFTMNVKPLTTPTEGTYSPVDGVEIDADVYFTLSDGTDEPETPADPTCDHANTETTVTTAPTVFSEGAAEGICPDCGDTVTVVLPNAIAQSEEIFTTTKRSNANYYVRYSEILGEDNHFYPTEENPNGQSLYVEFSLLWNESLKTVNAKDGNYALLGRLDGSSEGSFSPSWLFLKDNPSEQVWASEAGQFEAANTVAGQNIYGPLMSGEDGANYPNIGEYGWHRIGLVYTQMTDDTAPGNMTVSLYVDGVLISTYYYDCSSKCVLYTDNGDGTYTDNVNAKLVYYLFRDVKTSEGTAYFIIDDMTATVGGWAKEVEKLDTAVEGTYTTADGTEFDADVYFAFSTASDDADDSEDAETTTPGGSTDSEDAENAGGGASDSEDAENAGTTTPPIFSTPDSEDAA